MLKNRSRAVYLLTDIFFILLSFYIPYIAKYNKSGDIFRGISLPNFTEYCFIFTLWGILIIVSFKGKHLYRTDRTLTIPRELSRVFKYIFYSGLVVGSIVFFAKFKFFSRFVFIGNFVLLCIFLGSWRTIKRILLRKKIREGFRNINVLIIGAGGRGRFVLEEIQKNKHLGFKVVGFLDELEEGIVDDIPILGKPCDFMGVVRKHFVDEVIITLSLEGKMAYELIMLAQRMRLGARIIPDLSDKPIPILDVGYIGMIPFLTYKERNPHPSESVLKRLFDVVVSFVLIFVLTPLLVVILVLIKIDSKGPVFFVQKRIGFRGRVFNLYKFRSMIKHADKLKSEMLSENEIKDGVIFKIKNDPRITKLGRFLRKYSLDELPQFFNVIKGDMSLVGPRPPLSIEIEQYNDSQMDRLSIKPGITGLSQIKGRSDLSFSRWVKWDLWYVNHWSFMLDLKVFFLTIPAVLKGKGSY
ncbi:MAG: sugar transferase [Planctomycetota bacterium]